MVHENWKAIVAMASNRVIGRNGQLPWHLPEDLKMFKRLTMGHAIVMGRATYESIGRPLPGRRNVVLSRGGFDPKDDRVGVLQSVAALEALSFESDVFIIGGAGLFASLLPRCAELFLTFVYEAYEGDTVLPDFSDLFADYEVLEQHEAFEVRHFRRTQNAPNHE